MSTPQTAETWYRESNTLFILKITYAEVPRIYSLAQALKRQNHIDSFTQFSPTGSISCTRETP